METIMELSQETLESIGRYVRGNLGSWLREVTTERETTLLERSVRIEEELKAQRELIKHGFGLMDKRFEETRRDTNARFEEMRHDMNARFEEMRHDMNARFEQVDKRFEDMRHDTNARFEQVDKRFEEMRHDTNARFEQIDKRFEQVDKRFEQVDERFREWSRHATRWFTVISVILGLLTVSGILNTFLG